MGRLPGWFLLRRRAVMTPMRSAREVLADAQRFYRRRVFESWVRDYLHGRYLAGAIQPAGIGYAPAGWTTTTDHLLTLGHSRDDLVRAGVAVEGERGLRDVMRDRLTFPVRDHTGELVGFLGRAHPDDARAPKYLNTPATKLYEKRSTLYGLGEGVADLAAGATPLIVEGPFDKLAVDKMATRYGRPVVALASCGTALTREHIARIRSVTSAPVWFCFDADAAGQRAMLHAWEITADQGRSGQRFVRLPGGHDPASVHPRTLDHTVGHSVPMSVAVAEAQVHLWGRPDTWVRAELMVQALARRDAARISPEESGQWITTVARLTNLPVSSVQTTLIDHVAPTPTAEDMTLVRAASFPVEVTAAPATARVPHTRRRSSLHSMETPLLSR